MNKYYWSQHEYDGLHKPLKVHDKSEINGQFEANATLVEQSKIVKDCEYRRSKLTDREREFIDLLAARLCRGNGLTDNQADKLLKIWERLQDKETK